MTALLALDTHPFLAGPGAEWAEPLRRSPGMDCHTLPVAESDEDLGNLVELLTGDQSLLVQYPVARQARVEAMARVLRQVGPAPIALVATRLPPLSAAVLALLLRRLGTRPGWDAGRLAAAVPLLERQLITVSWARRLGPVVRDAAARGPRGRRPGPGWLSLNGFEIRPGLPAEAVLAVTPHRAAPVPVPEGAVVFKAARPGDDGRLSPGPASAGVPSPAALTWFGTPKSAEIVILSPDLADLTEAVERDLAARVQVRACAWCRLEAPGGDRCAFCGHSGAAFAVAR